MNEMKTFCIFYWGLALILAFKQSALNDNFENNLHVPHGGQNTVHLIPKFSSLIHHNQGKTHTERFAQKLCSKWRSGNEM